jgi:tRNA(Ile2) C34 agmatinyltransferase TiaS
MINHHNDQFFGADDDLSYAAEFLNLRRPPCPRCTVRMIAREPGGATFECLHCGQVQTLPARNRRALN